MTVVTRFAPSPTGHLHIGGARTAVFCWLLARHFGGRFLLRIEDTDRERSKEEYTASILSSMRWLGLDWDGEPFYQSRRMPYYKHCVERMVADGHAYWCSCSPEAVDAMREKARAEGLKPRYDGRCRELGLGPGPGRVARLKAPLQGEVAVDDLVKGRIVVGADELDDMVLWRADGTPTYNMAVVADDLDMGVSHVLRGDDHLSNTPKQILIYQALGGTLPLFGHVPMILGADKQKLSKRHGARAAIEYEKDGFLPQALVNYLVRLGWSHGDQELFTIKELIAAFDGSNLNRAPACFDPEKLLWVNARHMRETPASELVPLLHPFVQALNCGPVSDARLAAGIALFQPRASTLKDMAEQMCPLLLPAGRLQYDPKVTAKTLNEESKARLAGLRAALAACTPFEKTVLHDCLHSYVAGNSLPFKAVGPVLRLAVLGVSGGPDLPEVLFFLGREEALARIDQALALPL